jgi:ketosteroid isomerase-like protein
MKRLLFLLILVPMLSIIPQAQKSELALVSMVETERAFAKTSEDQGIRPSFMAFIAEDGILFRPRAVKGKQWMTEHPLPPSDKRPVLSWQPSFAGISSAGDLGYTTGPWQFKSDVHDAKPSGFGHFATVWKKQADGSWKFAIDLGISHPEPTAAESLWQLPKNYKQPASGKRVNVESETAALLKLENELSSDSASRGAQAAFLSRASDEVRVYREGRLPFVGKAAATKTLSTAANVWTWQPAFADVSSSGDVGYSYGAYQLKTADGKSESGNYMRVWKKQAGAWKIVMDVANPIPEPQSN